MSTRKAEFYIRLMALGLSGGAPRTIDEIEAAIANPANLTPEDLSEIEAEMRAAFEDAASGELTDEALALMERLTAGIEAVRAEVSARETQAAERAARVEALTQRITAETPAEEVETEEEPEETQVVEPAPVPEAVAASVPRVAVMPTRRPAPRADDGLVVTAGGDIPGFSTGQRIAVGDIGRALNERVRTLAHSRGTGRFPVATISTTSPDERRLGRDTPTNMERISRFTSPEAIRSAYGRAALPMGAGLDAVLAAGGLCAPSNARYDVFAIGEDDRPIRSALPRFAADRGGMRYIPPPTITQTAGGVVIWTEANDTTPSNPATKPCYTVACATELDILVDAVTSCLQIGNFVYRTFSEQVNAYLSRIAAQHAREAEDNLWNTMCTGSTAVTAGQNLSAARDIFATLARVGAGYRSRHRMARDAVLRVMLPAWVPDLIRADMIRQQPGDGTQAVTDAQIATWFGSYNFAATFSPDGGGQAFGAEGGGGVDPWPSTIEALVFAEGSWIFLDGGEVDIGVVRDSTLNATNDLRIFSETFEQVALVGVESLCVTMDVCPSGMSAGQNDSFDPCTSGS